ncbi:hypothetical protein TrVE_jg3791 [Triparma verrucosa]|uniref:PDZ domain-containing protein n=1 Tax=Triparma verrucosa TaxID=1606542 RepID=A0A9W7BGR1_9STRA|nr:hypothetical protein TrVE_jg3791 [Triparma verrucosa]
MYTYFAVFAFLLSTVGSFHLSTKIQIRAGRRWTQRTFVGHTNLHAAAVELSNFPTAVTYEVEAGPPLGVILEEFQSTSDSSVTPLVVSDVSEGLNAARLGVRTGDVLIGINGLSVLAPTIGFDIVMEAIKNEFMGETGKVKVTFFKGSEFGGVEGFDSLLGTILGGGEVEEVVEEVADVGGEGEVLNVFKDLNIEEEEVKEVGVGELFGSLFKETVSAVSTGLKEEPKEKQKEKGKGLFGGMFSQEVVQMEENPNQFANPLDDEAREMEGPRDAPNSNALDLQD